MNDKVTRGGTESTCKRNHVYACVKLNMAGNKHNNRNNNNNAKRKTRLATRPPQLRRLICFYRPSSTRFFTYVPQFVANCLGEIGCGNRCNCQQINSKEKTWKTLNTKWNEIQKPPACHKTNKTCNKMGSNLQHESGSRQLVGAHVHIHIYFCCKLLALLRCQFSELFFGAKTKTNKRSKYISNGKQRLSFVATHTAQHATKSNQQQANLGRQCGVGRALLRHMAQKQLRSKNYLQ